MGTSTSPDLVGITVKVDAAPGGKPEGALTTVGHLEDINPLIDKSRNVQKYSPLNDVEFDQIVALGTLTLGAFTATVLYDPEAREGINKIENAIDKNEEVQLVVELNNSKGANGTIYTQLCKVSSFKVDGETDGKLKASFSAERIGKPTITSASAT